jgi:hypothetical protein
MCVYRLPFSYVFACAAQLADRMVVSGAIITKTGMPLNAELAGGWGEEGWVKVGHGHLWRCRAGAASGGSSNRPHRRASTAAGGAKAGVAVRAKLAPPLALSCRRVRRRRRPARGSCAGDTPQQPAPPHSGAPSQHTQPPRPAQPCTGTAPLPQAAVVRQRQPRHAAEVALGASRRGEGGVRRGVAPGSHTGRKGAPGARLHVRPCAGVSREAGMPGTQRRHVPGPSPWAPTPRPARAPRWRRAAAAHTAAI